MIITIDGPAGTGKSTVSRKVADRLGFDFLDTGAMYRAVALEVLRRHCDLADARHIGFVARHCRIEFDWSRHPPVLLLNGEPVSHMLRGTDVTRASSIAAAVPAVREQLVKEQQRIGAAHGNLVTEGRDQGTAVFPEAELKFYLDATPQERARRRVAEVRARGETVNSDEVLREIIERDKRDSSRAVGPLTIPDGAQVIDTTHLTEDEVVELMLQKAAEVEAASRGASV